MCNVAIGSLVIVWYISGSLVGQHPFPGDEDRRQLWVALLVSEKFGVLGEVSAAAGAKEQLHGRVGSAVDGELGLGLEALAAVVAGELALSVVHELMVEEVVGSGEGHTAL